MSAHESADREEQIEGSSDRSFGLVVGGILTVIGGYQAFKGSGPYLWFLLPGLMLFVLGLALPRVLHPLNVLWTGLGMLLSKIVTPIMMLLVYVVAIVPIGVGMRLAGKDLLGLKKADAGANYWIQRSPPGPPPESLKDQF